MSPTRRIAIGAIVLMGGLAVIGWASPNIVYSLLTEEVDGHAISAPDAHEAAKAGDIFLIDIRRPDEWAATGSGEGAHRLDLRRNDFVDALIDIAMDRDAPIALICARGVRSARTANRLIEAGFTNIVDVPEGMLGSAAGPGWLRRGLPVVKTP